MKEAGCRTGGNAEESISIRSWRRVYFVRLVAVLLGVSAAESWHMLHTTITTKAQGRRLSVGWVCVNHMHVCELGRYGFYYGSDNNYDTCEL